MFSVTTLTLSENLKKPILGCFGVIDTDFFEHK